MVGGGVHLPTAGHCTKVTSYTIIFQVAFLFAPSPPPLPPPREFPFTLRLFAFVFIVVLFIVPPSPPLHHASHIRSLRSSGGVVCVLRRDEVPLGRGGARNAHREHCCLQLWQQGRIAAAAPPPLTRHNTHRARGCGRVTIRTQRTAAWPVCASSHAPCTAPRVARSCRLPQHRTLV